MIFIASYLLVHGLIPILSALLSQGNFCYMDEQMMEGSASTVVVTGLEHSIKNSDMEKRFKKVGHILACDLRQDRGIGIVVFKTPEEAQRAIQFSEHEGNDGQMRVQSAETFYKEQTKENDGDLRELVNKAKKYYTTLPRTKETIQFESNRAWQVWRTEDVRTRVGGGGMGGQGGGMGIFKGQDGQPGGSGPGGKGGAGGKGGGMGGQGGGMGIFKGQDGQPGGSGPGGKGGAGGKGGGMGSQGGGIGIFKGQDGQPGGSGSGGQGGEWGKGGGRDGHGGGMGMVKGQHGQPVESGLGGEGGDVVGRGGEGGKGGGGFFGLFKGEDGKPGEPGPNGRGGRGGGSSK